MLGSLTYTVQYSKKTANVNKETKRIRSERSWVVPIQGKYFVSEEFILVFWRIIPSWWNSPSVQQIHLSSHLPTNAQFRSFQSLPVVLTISKTALGLLQKDFRFGGWSCAMDHLQPRYRMHGNLSQYPHTPIRRHRRNYLSFITRHFAHSFSVCIPPASANSTPFLGCHNNGNEVYIRGGMNQILVVI